MDELYVVARRVLLDSLDALGTHRNAVIRPTIVTACRRPTFGGISHMASIERAAKIGIRTGIVASSFVLSSSMTSADRLQVFGKAIHREGLGSEHAQARPISRNEEPRSGMTSTRTFETSGQSRSRGIS